MQRAQALISLSRYPEAETPLRAFLSGEFPLVPGWLALCRAHARRIERLRGRRGMEAPLLVTYVLLCVFGWLLLAGSLSARAPRR